MKTILITAAACAALSACAALPNYIDNPTIAADTVTVNNDIITLENDYKNKASVTQIAADSSKLVADTAALDAAIKAAGTISANTRSVDLKAHTILHTRAPIV